MKLAIDTNSRRITKAGTTRYLEGLLDGLRRVAPDLEIQELEWPVDNLVYKQPARMLKTSFRELVWAPFIAVPSLKSSRPDVFHAPAGSLIPRVHGIPWVATLLDLAMLRHPERFRAWQRTTGATRLRRTLASDAVITISTFTADEAVSLMGAERKKLHPILLGCDFVPDSPEAAPAGFKVPGEFLLFVGSLEPGKNLSLLRQVYLMAESEGKPLPPLIVVGARWEGVGHEGEWPQCWIPAGRIPDDELVYLYRRALALVFPSKYEGFGFPPLEAMTLGCPVICSAVASLPEVVGEAALYAELTMQSYLDAIRRLLDEDKLRDDLVRLGRTQAAKFSWEKCARETLDVYRATARS